MRAIGYKQTLPVTEPDSLVTMELSKPVVSGKDMLVRIEAVSANPVDTKIRRGVSPPDGEYKVLGWDAVGVVDSIGDEVTLFTPGDKVWYAGAINAKNLIKAHALLESGKSIGKIVLAGYDL